MSGQAEMSHGWVDSRRVPTVDGRAALDLATEEGDGSRPRRAAGLWPCEDFYLTRLEVLTAEEAGELAEYARARVAEWLCGGGLGPVALGWRWSLAVRVLDVRSGMGLLSREWLRAHDEGVGSRRWEVAVWRELFGAGRGRWQREANRSRAALARAGKMGRVVEPTGDLRRWSLEEVLEWSAREGLECPEGVDGEVFAEEAAWLARVAARALCGWLSGSGWSLTGVLQRVYGLVFWRYKEIAGTMTGEDFSGMLGQGRAAFCELTSRLFEDPGELLLGYRPKTAGQKAAGSSAVYARNAAAHCPRRQIAGGVEGADGVDAAAVSAAAAEAAALAEDWALARRYVDWSGEGEEGPRLVTPRQREMVAELVRRDEEEFLRCVRGGNKGRNNKS